MSSSACAICVGSSIAWKATLARSRAALAVSKRVHVTLAEQSLRLDRLDARVARIEKRLDLVEG